MSTAESTLDGLAILDTLRPKVQNFCREYIIDRNGKQAAIRAGYSPKTAHVQASQHLSKLNVRLAVDALTRQYTEALDLTAARVMAQCACISFVDPRIFFNDDGSIKKPKDWDRRWAGAVSSYNARKKEITFHPKVPALGLSARMLRLVDADAGPVHTQGTFVVICPADAQPDQWMAFAKEQMAQIAPPSTPVIVNPGAGDNDISSTNGHHGTHTHNGDG
jgi:phage terminase small subunit